MCISKKSVVLHEQNYEREKPRKQNVCVCGCFTHEQGVEFD